MELRANKVWLRKREKSRYPQDTHCLEWISLEVSILGGREVGGETAPCGRPVTSAVDTGHWKKTRGTQRRAGQCLVTGFPGEPLFVVFANYHGVNTPTRAHFKLPAGGHWTREWEEMHTVGSQEMKGWTQPGPPPAKEVWTEGEPVWGPETHFPCVGTCSVRGFDLDTAGLYWSWSLNGASFLYLSPLALIKYLGI